MNLMFKHNILAFVDKAKKHKAQVMLENLVYKVLILFSQIN
jgi:hypothetical protein